MSELHSNGFSRSNAHRLLAHGLVPFHFFDGIRYIRTNDFGALLRADKVTRRIPS